MARPGMDHVGLITDSGLLHLLVLFLQVEEEVEEEVQEEVEEEVQEEVWEQAQDGNHLEV